MEKFGSGTLGGSDGYSSHRCGASFEEDESVKTKRAELERFKHFSERYEAHLMSSKLETRMLDNEFKVLGALKTEGLFCDGFVPAVQQILQNRNTLCHSYIFGYYRAKKVPSVNKGIFENLQLDLERHTELLSRLTG
jgi:hypothetical protein